MLDHAQMIQNIQKAMKKQYEGTKNTLNQKNSQKIKKIEEPKVIEVRTLKRGRSKSIVVPGVT
jgi:D-aminopeptidase